MKAMRQSKQQGFTLAEILIAVTIFSLVIALATQFFIDSYASLYKSQTALEANRSSRSFLDVISEDGMEADLFVIYPKYGSVSHSDRLSSGKSGDFLILAESQLGTLETEYQKLIGYYAKKRTEDEYFDIIVFEYDVPDNSKTSSLETLVNKALTNGKERIVFAQVKRLGNEGMFVNVDGGNVFTFHGIRVRFPEQAQPSKILHSTISVRS